MIVKILLIIIAAICKAFADSISPRKGRISRLGPFWDINKQGKFLPFTKYPWDGWHIFNSGMIIAFITSTTVYTPYSWWMEIPALGIIFILAFNFMYNKILK